MTLAAVPSKSPIDFLLNVENLDEFSGSTSDTFTDRLGSTKKTLTAYQREAAAAVNGLAAFNARGAFAGATAYALKDVYTSAGIAYVAVIAHVSSTVAADLAAGKVTVHQGATREDLAAPGASGGVGFMPAGVGAVAITVEDALRELGSATGYGVLGNGDDDDTAAILAAINANKGKIITIHGNPVCAGLLLSGPAYNGTKLIFDGEMQLGVRATAATTNFGGAWVGIIFKDVDGCELVMRGNGRRSLQPLNEHCHLVGLAGATNMTLPLFKAREVRGDGMYISQSNWQASSANTDGVTIGLFEVTNSVDDGRNGLSIISGDNITIETFRSNKVGVDMGGVVQPGGLDIEPDHDYHSCKNITIGSVNVVTAGTSGLAVQGRPGTSVTQHVTIGTAVVVNTCAPDQADGLGALTQTKNHTLVLASASDVTIKSYQGRFTNAYGDAVIATDCARAYVDGAVRHVREGARIGNDSRDVSGPGVVDSDINLKVSDVCRFGIRTGKITGSKIRGAVSAPVVGYFPGGLFGVYAREYAQTDSEYSVSVSNSSAWSRSYRNDNGVPATFVNTVIRDCDLSGASWFDYVAQVGDMQVPRYNVRGVTDQAAAPTVGTNLWVPGQYVRNRAPAVGQPKGWVFSGGAFYSEGNL
ncbi:MAG: hypothetical protein Q7T78_16960 [Rhodoferax sp.]|nr:hypothetical protein [Rhodoferax sp.]